MSLEEEYGVRRRTRLVPLASRLETHLKKCFEGAPRVDRIVARAKSVDRFVSKAEKEGEGGTRKYSDPLNQIQDQIGARIVVFYLQDVEAISNSVERYFRAIESQTIVPDSESEFGYFGKHYILIMPSDVYDESIQEGVPRFFELQIKTLFQHAWSEAEHDLGYKPKEDLSSEQRRRVAFTAAQAWGADAIFSELYAACGSS